MIWMISANGKMYDHASSFATNGFIDWRQKVKYNVGDIVFIYCTRPFKRVMYKCEVVKHSMKFSECIDDANFWIDISEYEKAKDGFYARLKLVEQVDTERLSLDVLKNHGLSAAPQGPIKINESLYSYIDSCFDDFYVDGLFTDVSKNEKYHEGHVKSIKVNIYERSSIARGKCIEHHGTSCMICGLNFGVRYGSLGEGFIHVHHLRPLHSIKKDYVVDYKNDLIPVCPNCHSMIHRIPNGENMNIDELKLILLNKNQTITETIPTIAEKSNTIIESTPKLQIKSVNEAVSSKTRSSNFKVGLYVTHNTFGKGKIIKVNTLKKRINVLFAVGEKIFMFDAFEKGFLTIDD